MSRAVLYCGDALTILQTLPAESVQCCVTSPPYWGLRDYGTARWEGGDSACKHRVPATGATMNKGNNNREGKPFPAVCGMCSARRVDSQLGLERTPEEYVENMVSVFREVRRVLREDGTVWLNVGDSYAARGYSGGGNGITSLGASAVRQNGLRSAPPGLKSKDLVGIPWRLAFALQADGWWLRSDIVWSKPNPMPESITDRPTKSHEFVFLLARAERYFYDADAIAEPAMIEHAGRYNTPFTGSNPALVKPGGTRTHPKGLREWKGTRNARTVWEITTAPYPGAHFATFPEELARRCILAGSSPGDTVLDPFGGSGTVAQVATGNGRNAIYIDLNQNYRELAKQRIGPLLCEVA